MEIVKIYYIPTESQGQSSILDSFQYKIRKETFSFITFIWMYFLYAKLIKNIEYPFQNQEGCIFKIAFCQQNRNKFSNIKFPAEKIKSN